MSLRSIQESLRRNSKGKIPRNITDGIHDPKEEQAVQSFRESLLANGQLPEKHNDYHTLLRFLRMRDFNIAKAKEMYLNMLKWREDFGVDAILKDFKFEEYDAVKRCYPHGFHGVDKSGRPLYVERIGSVDLNQLLQVTTIDRLIKHHISEQEKTMTLRYPACSLAAKKQITYTTAILDVKGLSINNFSKPAREIFKEFQKIDSNYYPETLNQLYIINAGSGFRGLWKILKAFFEARTLAKIQVLGSNYQSALQEVIDPSNLPSFLGGTCTCSEFGGCLLKDKGPWTNPEITRSLKEVLSNGQSSFNDLTGKISFEGSSSFQRESSGREMESNSGRKLDTPFANNEVVDVRTQNMQISQKISELEDWAKNTKEILQTLLSKQLELMGHIEQLRKLTSDHR